MSFHSKPSSYSGCPWLWKVAIQLAPLTTTAQDVGSFCAGSWERSTDSAGSSSTLNKQPAAQSPGRSRSLGFELNKIHCISSFSHYINSPFMGIRYTMVYGGIRYTMVYRGLPYFWTNSNSSMVMRGMPMCLRGLATALVRPNSSLLVRYQDEAGSTRLYNLYMF